MACILILFFKHFTIMPFSSPQGSQNQNWILLLILMVRDIYSFNKYLFNLSLLSQEGICDLLYTQANHDMFQLNK